MSYSFSITAGTKAEAKQKVADSFDNMVTAQPNHAADRDAAVACAHAFVDTLTDHGEGDEIHVSMHGSLGWRHEVSDEFISASVGVSASFRAKPAEKMSTDS